MRYVKWTFWAVIALIAAGFLFYTLPRYDVVRITDTLERRVDYSGRTSLFWANPPSKDAQNQTRDVYFLQAITNADKPMMYRNEDTGWGWPPYFKFNSSTVQTRASDLVSTAQNPQWVRVTRYGVRSELFSTYPNVIRLKPVDSPDVSRVPWVSIVILVLLAAVFWALRVRWIRFRAKKLDPVFEEVGDSLDEGRSRVSGWFSKKDS